MILLASLVVAAIVCSSCDGVLLLRSFVVSSIAHYCVRIVPLLDCCQGEYHDDYLYENWESGVIANIMCGFWHRVLLLVSHIVIDIPHDCCLSFIVASIVHCCCHRSLLLAWIVIADIVHCYCDHLLLLSSPMIADNCVLLLRSCLVAGVVCCS